MANLKRILVSAVGFVVLVVLCMSLMNILSESSVDGGKLNRDLAPPDAPSNLPGATLAKVKMTEELPSINKGTKWLPNNTKIFTTAASEVYTDVTTATTIRPPNNRSPLITITQPKPTASQKLKTASPTVAFLPQEPEPNKKATPTAVWKDANNFTKIYSAHYDNRPSIFGPAVIVFGVQDYKKKVTFMCHLTYSNGDTKCAETPAEAKSLSLYAYDYIYLSFYYVCRLPSSRTEIPKYISLSPNPGCKLADPVASRLPVHHEKPDKKKQFGICVQGPAYNISDAQIFVSFIEMHRILGVEHFTVYTQDVKPAVIQFLQQYVQEGLLELLEWNIPVTSIHYRGQEVLLNECLFRNMYRVDYLALVDLDEVLVPTHHSNWAGMMKQIDTSSSRSVFQFPHTFMHKKDDKFIEGFDPSLLTCSQENIPRYFTHRYQSQHPSQTGWRFKLIVKPSEVVRLSIHEPMEPITKTLRVMQNDALLYHYRAPDVLPQDPVIVDNKLRTYISPFVQAFNKRLCQ